MKCPKCKKDITNENKAKSKIYGLNEYHCLKCYEEIKDEYWAKQAEKKQKKERRVFYWKQIS